jgi:hypothetical protein
MDTEVGSEEEDDIDFFDAVDILPPQVIPDEIDNLETQKKSMSMKNSQFFDYLLYAKSK